MKIHRVEGRRARFFRALARAGRFLPAAVLAASGIFSRGADPALSDKRDAGAVVIACDEAVKYPGGTMTLLDDPGVGSLVVLPLGSDAAAPIRIPNVPSSFVGPPLSVVSVPRTSLLLATGAMKVVRGSGGSVRQVQDRRLTLASVAASGGAVVDSIEIGLQPSGISVSPDGSFALVANRGEGAVSVIAIEGARMREVRRVKVGGPDDSLSHVEIAADGRRALASLNQRGEVLLLGIDRRGRGVDGVDLSVAARLATGKGPYAIRFLDGDYAVVAHLDSQEVVLLGIGGRSLRVLQRVRTGRAPEGLDAGRNGQRVTVTCMEGFGLADTQDAAFGKPARVMLLERKGERLEQSDAVPVQGGPQFALFSPDGENVIVSETGPRQVEIFNLRGGKLVSTGRKFALPGEPIAAARILMRGR